MKLVGKFVLFVINVAILVAGVVVGLELFDRYSEQCKSKYVVHKEY